MKIPISKRLLLCAQLVPPGARVADIGTDHGYLGLYLLQNGRAAHVIAADLRPQPLQTARQNTEKYGFAGQMEFRLFISRENLLAGPHGIMEPDRRCPLVPAQAAELILVPALCCDKQGFRLGQGGGFYDRWLSAHSCPSVCLCRQPLLCDALPIEGHDRPVDLVLTELGQWPEGRKGTAIPPSP